jgi:CBS domain-containing protein
MKIKEVLATKGQRIVTVPPNSRVDHIPRLFDERHIASAVVVDAGGKPLGIVTDRLLIRALARRGAEALHLSVADIMESPAPHCTPQQSVQEALRYMTEHRVRHLLVLDQGRMAGLVSIGDLVKHRLLDAELESKVLRELALGQLVRTEEPATVKA